MPAIYRGSGGVNRQIKAQYRGLSGVNRTIKEQYRGYGGVNRKIFASDLLNTVFAEKGADWIESGGTFNYGAGLYGADAETKGTNAYNVASLSTVQGVQHKHIKIPVTQSTLSALSIEVSAYAYSTLASRVGFMYIALCNNDAAPILSLIYGDAWAGNTNTAVYVLDGSYGSAYVYDAGSDGKPYNGLSTIFKVTYNAGTYNVYLNNTLVKTYTNTKTSLTFNNVKVAILANTDTNYSLPAYRINSLKVVDQVI